MVKQMLGQPSSHRASQPVIPHTADSGLPGPLSNPSKAALSSAPTEKFLQYGGVFVCRYFHYKSQDNRNIF